MVRIRLTVNIEVSGKNKAFSSLENLCIAIPYQKHRMSPDYPCIGGNKFLMYNGKHYFCRPGKRVVIPVQPRWLQRLEAV
jgi:hypothetical protein